MSADVGELDPDAMAGALEEDPDRAVELLAGLARATDRTLRERARSLAAELLLPVARHGGDTRRRGAVHLVTSARQGLDLDVDATLERAVTSGVRDPTSGVRDPTSGVRDPTSGRPAAAPGLRLGPEDLRWRTWERPGRAYVLLVDASGSVAGRTLATALVTAAALTHRLGPDDQLAVVAFWSRSVVLRPLASAEPARGVLDALFDLRGGDTTDLAGGLRAALAQAATALGSQRDVVVLTDGLANAGDDPAGVAAAAAVIGARVHVLGLSDEADAVSACTALAAAGGGRYEPLPRPSRAPAALAEILAG